MKYSLLSSNDWGVVEGCTKVSAGCKNCYAEEYLGEAFNTVRVIQDRIDNPPQWRSGMNVAIAECGDLFHEHVPVETVARVMEIVSDHPDVSFRVLTKRIERLSELFSGAPLPENLMVGVSIEDQETADSRIPYLDTINSIRFVSAQPLLGHVTLPDVRIDWIVVGQEWCEDYRHTNEDWVRSLREQCRDRKIPMSYQQKMVNQERVVFPELDGIKIQQFPRKKSWAS